MDDFKIYCVAVCVIGCLFIIGIGYFFGWLVYG